MQVLALSKTPETSRTKRFFSFFYPFIKGRTAENVLFSTMIKENDIILGILILTRQRSYRIQKAHNIDCTIDGALI